MENKSIGKFISVLRKKSGMTQKELGDKLFVSDKAISRWEREESAPEISLLPAIAEVFGVTIDELINGELNPSTNETVEIERKETSAVPATATTEERKIGFKLDKPLLKKIVAICGSIAILLIVGLIVFNSVEFTSTSKYSSFANLKSEIEHDYDQWVGETYGADYSQLEQVEKVYKVQDKMFISDAQVGEQFVDYYYHKDHYRNIGYVSDAKNNLNYQATRIIKDEIEIAKWVCVSALVVDIALAVAIYFILAWKNQGTPTTSESTDETTAITE